MTSASLPRPLVLGPVRRAHWPWTATWAQTPPATSPAPLTLPLAPMLGRNWQPGLDPADFLVSEKLDGVRALWDGQTLRFRSGRRIAASGWFFAVLPATPLDAVVCLGRVSCVRPCAHCRRTPPGLSGWDQLLVTW